MIDIQKVFIARTPEEALEATGTMNLIDAELVAKQEYARVGKTWQAILVRCVMGAIGLFLLFAFPLFLPVFVVSLVLLCLAFFSRTLGRRQLYKKFIELRTLVKTLEGYPEIIITKKPTNLLLSSPLLSRVARVSGESLWLANTDKAKHSWDYSGYCKIDTGRTENKSIIWQDCHVYAYGFRGRVPQILLLPSDGPFIRSLDSTSPTLMNMCPPWKCFAPLNYEIETLAILTPNTIENLATYAKTDGASVALEVVDTTFVCFVPTTIPSIQGVLADEKIADMFAKVFLPRLEGATMEKIGDIAPVLDFFVEPDEESEAPYNKEDARAHKKILFAVPVFIVALMGGLMLGKRGMFPLGLLPIIPFVFVGLVLYLMPKRDFKKWMRGSGLLLSRKGERGPKNPD